MGWGGVLLLDQGSLELSLVLILPPEWGDHIQVCASTPKCPQLSEGMYQLTWVFCKNPRNEA